MFLLSFSIEGFLTTKISLELYSDLKPEGAFSNFNIIIIPIIMITSFSEGKRGARFIPSHAAK